MRLPSGDQIGKTLSRRIEREPARHAPSEFEQPDVEIVIHLLRQCHAAAIG
jgi:hypothetical protein